MTEDHTLINYKLKHGRITPGCTGTSADDRGGKDNFTCVLVSV
jgi:serine/threonine protein phosphatase PrpC